LINVVMLGGDNKSAIDLALVFFLFFFAASDP
jgi:hypothetical protein